MLFAKTLLLLAASSGLTSAHYIITNMFINGVDQGAGKCLRNPPNTNPVTNINSNDMSCNVNGHIPAARACPVKAGSEITLLWRTWPDGSQPGSLDPGHQGPCAVYLKSVSDSTKSPGYGAGWFKIWEDGYRDGKFCTDRLIANGGRMTFRLPRDLKGGDYLVRGEHLALHQAQNTGGAQWYIGCGQLVVSSTGGRASPSWVTIPGHVRSNDPGVLYNLWSPNRNHNAYVVPGPKPYKQGSSGSDTAIENRRERGTWNCLVENANWCGVALPGFQSGVECYRSTENCWAQLEACYKSAPATGSAGCRRWESFCNSCQSNCRSCDAARNCRGNFTF